MMRWLVGSVLVTCCGLSTTALAQAPKGAATGAFPTSEAAPTATPAPTPGPAPVAPPATDPPAAIPPPPPAAAPAPATPAPPPAAPASAGPGYIEPPPPPPRDTDLRPIRQRRPFFIGGELGWNGMTGLGALFSYHFVPNLALDTGLGLSLTGGRIAARVRANLLTGEWTPFFAAGFSYAGGTSGQDVEQQSKGEKAKLRVYKSPFAQLGVGVNYTGTEGFVFSATTGYSILLRDHNTYFVSGSRAAYDDVKPLYGGGLILSVSFGYAF